MDHRVNRFDLRRVISTCKKRKEVRCQKELKEHEGNEENTNRKRKSEKDENL